VTRLADADGLVRRSPLPETTEGRSGPGGLGRPEVGQGWLGWIFVVPIVVLIVVLVGYPLILSFEMSMQHVGIYPGETSDWVGLGNYADLFSGSDTMSAAVHTAGYWIIAVTVELCIGLSAALALRNPFRGRGVILALLVLPWALPPVVAGLLWRRVFDPTSGWLDGVLYQLHIIDHYQIWFTQPTSTIPLIALVSAWGLVPLIALILLGGLQGIPSELYEAAQLDGASSSKSFRYITLPLLQPSIAAALAIGTVVSFGIFDVIYVLVGADRDARSVMMQVYLTTFSNLDFGHGAALAVLISIVSLFLSGAYLVFFRRAAI
jgi:multiple sugar transport system permease protein